MKYDFPRLLHQNKWLDWSFDRLRVGNFSITGSGKTVMTMDWINKIGFQKLLILCPKSAMKHTWYDALQDNFIHDELIICKGSPQKRLAQMEHFLKNVKRGAFIMNYDILDKHKDQIKHMGFDCAILDESHKLANATSDRSKAAMKIFNKAAWGMRGVAVLTGTPSPKDLFGYYMAMSLISGIQKETFFDWRKRCFTEYCIQGTMFKTYTPREGVEDAVLASVSEMSFTATKEDLKLPPDRIRKVESIPMSPKQNKVYKALIDDYVVNVNGVEISCDSNGSRATKLLQIASGFIYDNDGNAHELGMDRITLMKEVLESYGEDEQCIIWYAYKWQREIICKVLGCESYSSLSDKKKEEYVEDFVSGKNKYFIAHPRSCGESLTLTNCRHEIWYCLNGDLRGWMQACDRVYRLGQDKVVISTTLQSEDTYDEHVYDGIINGFDSNKITMDFFRKESQ